MNCLELRYMKLLICLMPGPMEQAAIGEHQCHWNLPCDCWLTELHRLHMTIYSLGYVPVERAQILRQALCEMTVEQLEIVLRTPTIWRSHVAVLLADKNAGLHALRSRMEPMLKAAGLKFQRTWKPHVTLTRAALNAKPPLTFQPISWTACEFVLIWSQLWPAFAHRHYEVLERYGSTPGKRLLHPTGDDAFAHAPQMPLFL